MGKVQAHRRRVNALRRKLAEVEAVKGVAEEELAAVSLVSAFDVFPLRTCYRVVGETRPLRSSLK